MVLESFTDKTYTTNSDVWSFAVTCWETFELGKEPYLELDGVEIRTMIVNGGRLKKPDLCPGCVFCIVKSCWNENPNQRPSFAELRHSFAGFVQSILLY